MKLFLLNSIFLLSVPFLASGQLHAVKRTNVDSIVTSMNIRSIRDTFLLADTLTLRFATDSEKVRAIYFWMAQNISYDWKAFKQGSPVRFNGDAEDYYDRRVVNTLATKKGVCEDYALVFSCLCRLAGIRAAIISGYGLLVKPSGVVQALPQEANHAWNAVMINKKWYLLDVTWASGKLLNDYYYLTPPQDFILEHFPEDPKWQFVEPAFDWKGFVKNARYREKHY